MIKEAGINFTALADENFDEPLGVSTGAAVYIRRHRRGYGGGIKDCV